MSDPADRYRRTPKRYRETEHLSYVVDEYGDVKILRREGDPCDTVTPPRYFEKCPHCGKEIPIANYRAHLAKEHNLELKPSCQASQRRSDANQPPSRPSAAQQTYEELSRSNALLPFGTARIPKEPRSVRCPYCHCQIKKDQFEHHVRLAHPEHLPSSWGSSGRGSRRERHSRDSVDVKASPTRYSRSAVGGHRDEEGHEMANPVLSPEQAAEILRDLHEVAKEDNRTDTG